MKSLRCTFAVGFAVATTACAVGTELEEPIEESVDDGDPSAGIESEAFAVGTTSICTTSIYGPTQRYDRVPILTSTNEATERAVLVTNGAVQRTQRFGQVSFIESGGLLDETLAPGYRTWTYVAAGGAVNQFAGERAFMKNRTFMSCQPAAKQSPNQSIMYEQGATFSGCTNAIQRSTPNFRRCSSTTPVAQVFPTPKFTYTRSGTTYTFRNTSSGYYETVRWSVARECFRDESDGRIQYGFAQSTNRGSYTINLPTRNADPDCPIAFYLIELQLSSRGFPTVSTLIAT
jgi:hypothetical protein